MANLEYLTTDEVAEQLAVTKTIVVAMVRDGTLPALRTEGGRLQFERRVFERWIRDQYAETRRWVLAHQSRGTHGPWQADWND